jgi:hypothetical protein
MPQISKKARKFSKNIAKFFLLCGCEKKIYFKILDDKPLGICRCRATPVPRHNHRSSAHIQRTRERVNWHQFKNNAQNLPE